MRALPVVLALNALWFGAAFVYFGVVPARAAAILVPREARAAPLLRTLVTSVRFLGGMNLALAVFAASLLPAGALFPEPRQNALFCAIFGLAHATQVWFNVPVLLAGRRGDAPWPVTRGPMRFIFATDGALAAANVALAGVLAATGR
ncbi:MAG TPA: hypothetical protein VFS43_39175 [Polyangiaceae bacterium]|nr:hypothetical protein [Polyangiaceae bacterium]